MNLLKHYSRQVFFTGLILIVSSAPISSHAESKLSLAGMCIGGVFAMKATGLSLSELSDLTKQNFDSKVMPFVFDKKIKKWENTKNDCISKVVAQNGTQEQVYNCISSEIKDRNAAEFWKHFTLGYYSVEKNPAAVTVIDMNCKGVIHGK